MEISVTSLQRLPKYLRVLKELKNQNIEYVSSTMVAEELKQNSIQVQRGDCGRCRKIGSGFNELQWL